MINTHLRNHNDPRLVRKNHIVRRRMVRRCNRARLLRHAAFRVLHRHLEVVVPTRFQSPGQQHIGLAHRIVFGARQCLDVHGGRWSVVDQLELERIVEFLVAGPQPIDDGADGSVRWHQDEAHSGGRIEFGIDRMAGLGDGEQRQQEDGDEVQHFGVLVRCSAKRGKNQTMGLR